jgi:uncharacterized RDD family membrane protein YckC
MSIGRTAPVFDVATPEGVPLPFTIGSTGDRLHAFFLDSLVIVAGTIAVWIACVAMMVSGARGLGLTIGLLVTFALRNAYFIVCEARWGGRTLGKRAAGLRVIARDGGPLTAEAVLARNLTREVEVFLPLSVLLFGRSLAPDLPGWALLLATLWVFVFALLPLASRERLRCGDLVAGTLVVLSPAAVLLPDLAAPAAGGGRGGARVGAVPAARGGAEAAAGQPGTPPSPGPPGPPGFTGDWRSPEVPRPGPEQAEIAFSREQLDIYGIHELQVLEEVLRRESAGTIGREVIEEVGAKIKTKIGWQAEGGQVPTVQFLRAFYRAQRARLEQKLLFGERQERKREPGRPA